MAVFFIHQINHNLSYRGFENPLALGDKFAGAGDQCTYFFTGELHDPPLNLGEDLAGGVDIGTGRHGYIDIKLGNLFSDKKFLVDGT